MKIISKTFFITGLGRSGTSFLAKTLNQSSQYRVIHEWHIPPICRDEKLESSRRFPIIRFMFARYPFSKYRKGYGEVNSYLRHTLDSTRVGMERYIEKRGIILREPRNVIASVMNRENRTVSDFDMVCERILTQYSNLLKIQWNPILEYKVFHFEKITSNLNSLQEVLDWLEINDVILSKSNVEQKINTNKNIWFPQWENWEQKYQNKYHLLEKRFVPVKHPYNDKGMTDF